MTSQGALSGAFWAMLFGLIFFVPFFGLAVGAAMGAMSGKFADYGINDAFIAPTIVAAPRTEVAMMITYFCRLNRIVTMATRTATTIPISQTRKPIGKPMANRMPITRNDSGTMDVSATPFRAARPWQIYLGAKSSTFV